MSNHSGRLAAICVAALVLSSIRAGESAPTPTSAPTTAPSPTPATPQPVAQDGPPKPQPVNAQATPTAPAPVAPTLPVRVPGPAPSAAPGYPPAKPDVLDMTNPTYLIELANTHIKFGAFERAEPLIRTALEKAKDPAQKQSAYQVMGALLHHKGDWKGAAENYEAAVAGTANASERGRLSISLADAYVRANEPDKAEKVLLEAMKPNKDRPDDQWIQQTAFRALTQAWQSKPGGIDAFVAESEATLAKTPDDAATLEHLVEVYSTIKHEPLKAVPCLEKLSQQRPDDKGLQYRLASACQQGRQFDKAIDVYKKLIAAPGARKEEVRAQTFQIGMLLLQSGKKDEAVTWIKDNYAKDAAGHDYSLLAMFYDQADMRAEAEAALNQLADTAKTPDEKADAKVRIAEIALRKKDYQKANDVAQAVLKDFKDVAGINVRANSVIKRAEAEKAKPVDAQPTVASRPANDPKPLPVEKKDTVPVPPAGPRREE